MTMLRPVNSKTIADVTWRLASAAPVLTVAGCSGAASPPSVPLFGSYFPAWIICAVGGIVFAMIMRAAFVRTRLDAHLPMAPLVYLCLAISGSIGLWFLWSGVM